MNSIRIVETIEDTQAARAIRHEVFVLEQAVPLILEVDSRDALPDTIQVLLTIDGEPAGTGRLLTDPDHAGLVHVGRLAVLKKFRGRRLGAELLAALEAAAIARQNAGGHPAGTPGASPAGNSAESAGGHLAGGVGLISELSAQEHALDFYRKAGYETIGNPRYLDAGIWHHDMRKVLIAPAS